MPLSVAEYLKQNDVPFGTIRHHRAIPALELSAALHVTGYQVAKPVLLNVDGKLWMAVIPAPMHVDEERVAQILNAESVELASEDDFKSQFPDCELGAEPPFGKLFGVPLIVDEGLAKHELLFVRAGSHETAIRLRYQDFARLETPRIGHIARPAVQRRWGVHWEERRAAQPVVH